MIANITTKVTITTTTMTLTPIKTNTKTAISTRKSEPKNCFINLQIGKFDIHVTPHLHAHLAAIFVGTLNKQIFTFTVFSEPV